MADTFKPGEKVKKSGIYTVLHEDEHTQRATTSHASQARCSPPCGDCEGAVRFRLKHHAMHITKNEHFKTDSTEADERDAFARPRGAWLRDSQGGRPRRPRPLPSL